MGCNAWQVHEDPAETGLKMAGCRIQATMEKQIPIPIALAMLLSACAGPAEKFHPDWESLKQYKVPDWFRDAKFGIYFHWGVYSGPAAEAAACHGFPDRTERGPGY